MVNDNGNLVMPVSPMYGANNGNNGGFGGDWGWIILLLLLAGVGNGFGGFGGFGGGEIYPWMNQAEVTTNGFQNAALSGQLNGIQSGVQNLSTQLCNCCGDMAQTVTSGFANAETAANARQIANLQQAFASQTAMSQGFSNLASQFADCCCENRLANCQTQNIIQSEGSQTRFADANNTRDIIQSQTTGIQTILDKLCQLELDAKNDKINDLERQLTMANLSASQIAQTAQIERGQLNTMNNLVTELRSCPIPSQPVAGNTPLFSCNPSFNGYNGCGCGCGNF